MQEYPDIEEAVPLLQDNISNIHTVGEWAAEVGYSRSYFSQLVRKRYNTTPHRIILHAKRCKVLQQVRVDPDPKGVAIAQEAGFQDVKSLCKFLQYHYDTTLTTLRRTVKARKKANLTN